MDAELDRLRRRAELVDLGCGTGGSLRSAARRFGVEGIGLEIRQNLVDKAREKGLPVFQADVRTVDPAEYPNVKYAVLDNVLEHLPTFDDVRSVLAAACQIASRCVYVRHPSFEDEDYLAELGYKLYWTDWRRHPSHIRLDDYRRWAAELGLACIIQPIGRIPDTMDDTVLPIDAPPDQPHLDKSRAGVYEQKKHGPKALVPFDRPVYYTFDILFLTGEGIPTVTYEGDPFTERLRPWISWPGERTDAGDGDEDGRGRGAAPVAAGAEVPSGEVVVPAPAGGDDHPALQRAVDDLAATGGGTVVLGPGTYRLGATLVLPDLVGVVGSTVVTTRLQPLVAGLDAVVRLGSGDGDVEGCSLEDLTVDGSVDGAPSAADGVAVAGPASFCTLRNVRIVEVAGRGVALVGPSFEHLCLERLFIEGCGGAGLVLERSACRSVFLSRLAVVDVARDGAPAAVQLAGRCHVAQLHVDEVPSGTTGVRFEPGSDDTILTNFAIGGRDEDRLHVDDAVRAVHLGTSAPLTELEPTA